MLRSANDLRGYQIQATDGKIGEVHDLYFDDLAWVTRYIIVDTGRWLPGRLVLIAPGEVGTPNWSDKVLPVSLSKERVENSPSANIDKPVSRQHQSALSEYYGWPVYWAGPPPGEVAAVGTHPVQTEVSDREGDPHLRSVLEVSGYHIAATDGEIGHVEDFVLDSGSWDIRYMVVDTRNWLPGRKVLVAPAWISAIRWEDERVKVGMTRQEVKDSPEYDPSQPVNRDYEVRLYDYYGRPAYWRR